MTGCVSGNWRKYIGPPASAPNWNWIYSPASMPGAATSQWNFSAVILAHESPKKERPPFYGRPFQGKEFSAIYLLFAENFDVGAVRVEIDIGVADGIAHNSDEMIRSRGSGGGNLIVVCGQIDN